METTERREADPAPGDATVSLMIPPEARYARLVREQVTAFAEACTIDDGDLHDLLIALGEALANAIEHARSSESIEVRCRLSGDALFVATVVDKGVGFSPPADGRRAIPQPEAERGRGLPLMERCTDWCSVRSEPGKGTAVELTRRVRVGRER
jgi:anti-sigma regulatory factor (Ser/Thr protein kinase)